ncbi:hypothetical protein Pcinc_033630 [Petrolisthes cinctipes]|uniref:Uncharacterized protein n=1 Tax=Petrolisthes cinctipes TaxID=88211 RepID=A0AAE1ES07_PETCI|nr:hypothetical protein Pcinc_033630 [Petrolisthes cinctipes]
MVEEVEAVEVVVEVDVVKEQEIEAMVVEYWKSLSGEESPLCLSPHREILTPPKREVRVAGSLGGGFKDVMR